MEELKDKKKLPLRLIPLTIFLIWLMWFGIAGMDSQSFACPYSDMYGFMTNVTDCKLELVNRLDFNRGLWK